MEKLYQYFKDLSEGKFDIEKTVEYQFIRTLQEIDTPIGLNEFAKKLNLTSIIIKFLGLMANAGLVTQSEHGIATNVGLSETPIFEGVTPQKVEPLDPPPIEHQPPHPTPMSSTGEDTSVTSPPPAVPAPSASTSSSTDSVPPVPSVPASVPSTKKSMEDSVDDELPPHMQERLNFERMRTGSKKPKFGLGEEGLQDLFDQLGSLEEELKEDE